MLVYVFGICFIKYYLCSWGKNLVVGNALSCFPFLGLGMVNVCMAWLSGSFHWAIVRTFIVSVKRLVYFSYSI